MGQNFQLSISAKIRKCSNCSCTPPQTFILKAQFYPSLILERCYTPHPPYFWKAVAVFVFT